MSYTVKLDNAGLKSMQSFVDKLSKDLKPAVSEIINETAVFAAKAGEKSLNKEYNFPNGYVGDRLYVSRPSNSSTLEATITGRFEGTSLARFTTSPVKFGRQRGVKVRVKNSSGTSTFRRGFFMRLRQGRTLNADTHNVGLAYRLRKGEKISNKTKPLNSDKNVVLLYGVSVDQAFSSTSREPAFQQRIFRYLRRGLRQRVGFR